MSGVCRLSCAFHAAGNSPPDVRRGDTSQWVYTVQVRWFEAARDVSAAVEQWRNVTDRNEPSFDIKTSLAKVSTS